MHKEYYLLSTSNHLGNDIAYPSLSMIEDALGMKLPMEPTDSIYVNSCKPSEWAEGDVAMDWEGSYYYDSAHDIEDYECDCDCDEGSCTCIHEYWFSVSKIKVYILE